MRGDNCLKTAPFFVGVVNHLRGISKRSNTSSEKSCVKISSNPLVLAMVYSFESTPESK